MSALPLPVPPFEEAVEIVRRIERAFVWLDRAIANHSGAFQLVNKLDSALLAKAFDGELTPQNLHDESASALVERVNAEWVAQLKKVQVKKQKYPVQKQEEFMGVGKKLEQILIEATDWLSAQAAFQRCGIGDGASTEEIERIYSELRDLDRAGKLEAEAVNDEHGRKIYDRIRLKVV